MTVNSHSDYFMNNKPNILYIMTDQQRFDTIAALGNSHIRTPNLDRLVRRGISFTNAYSSCPVCVPARSTIRTGCEPPKTGQWFNSQPKPRDFQEQKMESRCGDYLPRTMAKLGYRTFGVGKFHTMPDWDEELGYETHLHTEELYEDKDQRSRDAYSKFITKQHPEYDFIEQLHGERTEMYYMPQMSPLPQELTVESFVTDRAIEQIQQQDDRPWFGFVSFIGPHPPFAPPIPFNRRYDPDKMPNPIKGDISVDHADEQIPRMNYAIWAEEINDFHARALKARYYGEISYIDKCIGKLLDTVEALKDSDNTLICFFSDHGDHLGDHHAWQKESFFEQSCHVPFLLSWPERLPQNVKNEELVCLTDLFAISTGVAGAIQIRDGIDVLGMVQSKAKPRDFLYGYYGIPGTERFKIMVRHEQWKYIFIANGGRELLFDLKNDPNELNDLSNTEPQIIEKLNRKAVKNLAITAWSDLALFENKLKAMPFKAQKRCRIKQFDSSRGVKDFQT